jgi:hypothetical protein
MGSVIVQIVLLDIVFSLDSVLTAVGMANEVAVMIAAVVISVGVMLVASGPLARFVHAHPSVKMLALAFLMLIGVHTVGPKMAIAMLGGGPPRELVAALAAGDVARLQAVPGIGKRTAERIVGELREKVGVVPDDAGAPITVTRGDDPRRLARDGLIELGFAPAEAQALVEGASGETAEELLSSALRGARA